MKNEIVGVVGGIIVAMIHRDSIKTKEEVADAVKAVSKAFE